MLSDKYRSPGNRQTQTRPSDCQMEKRDSSLQRTHLHCSRVQWRHALQHCIRRFALHSVMYGLDSAALPWKPIPWSSLGTVLELIWRPPEVWKVCSNWLCRQLATSVHYAPQHPLTLLCPFTCPTTSWLNSQSLPLCYNTTDSWLWNI